jgi:hypothetical protein
MLDETNTQAVTLVAQAAAKIALSLNSIGAQSGGLTEGATRMYVTPVVDTLQRDLRDLGFPEDRVVDYSSALSAVVAKHSSSKGRANG